MNCADVDECRQNPCNAFEDCTNRPGGFECTCRPGFEDTGDGCVNINECENGIAQCPLRSSCVDRVPMQAPNSQRYECVCDPGFEKDGDVCVDIDECRTDPNVNCPQTVAAKHARPIHLPMCRRIWQVGDECIREADARCNEDADCIPSMAGCATTCGEDGQCIEFCGREGCPDPTEEGVTYVSQDSVQCRQIDLGGGLQCVKRERMCSLQAAAAAALRGIDFQCDAPEFACGDGRCTLAAWTCDGDNDCLNGADEQNCGPCAGNVFRCADGMGA